MLNSPSLTLNSPSLTLNSPSLTPNLPCCGFGGCGEQETLIDGAILAALQTPPDQIEGVEMDPKFGLVKAATEGEAKSETPAAGGEAVVVGGEDKGASAESARAKEGASADEPPSKLLRAK
eukprot:1188397-Prorocentrum_minimum.AAC.1